MDGEGLSVLLTEACEASFFVDSTITTSIKGDELDLYKDSLHCPRYLSASPVLMVACKMGYMPVRQAEENSCP